MMNVLTEEVIASFKDAARKLTGAKRRAFQAQVTLDYLGGNVWKAERVFGWSHPTVTLGLNELRTGIICLGNFSARGNHKTEAKFPELEADIRALAGPESQTDPKFQSPFLYTRMTAKAVRQALIDEKGWTDEELPHVNTIGEILNRLGYKLRRVQKTKPLKKIKGTDAIFDNVRRENQAADDDPDVIRISMDAKAKVAVGDYSRDGESRGAETTKALDHDPEPEQKLVPQGILDVTSCLLSIFIAISNGTSDFFADCLEQWWEANKGRYPHGRRLVINLDNGPENSSHRTQFMNRMVMFADATDLEIKLVYYPPYHSKYNPIEHCWGVLENHWDGTLLNSVATVVEWARTMTWKGTRPIVKLIETTYDKGVRIAKDAFRTIESRLQRHDSLPASRQRIANMFPPAHRSAWGSMSHQCIAQTSGGCTRSVRASIRCHIPSPARVTSVGNRQRPHHGGTHEGRIHRTPTGHRSPTQRSLRQVNLLDLGPLRVLVPQVVAPLHRVRCRGPLRPHPC
jgi:hypothetical protein